MMTLGYPLELSKVVKKWNFAKFLVGKSGQVVARFGPRATSEEIAEALSEHL